MTELDMTNVETADFTDELSDEALDRASDVQLSGCALPSAGG
jgi:hypothetical protein